MRILPLNSISFTSIPLYNVKLRKQNEDGTCGFVDAQFSKLDENDEDDIDAVGDVCVKWARTEFGVDICGDFLFENKTLKNDFYAIERTDDNGKRKIYSMAEFIPQINCIGFIQSDPNNKKEGIKGPGELILWGIGREIKKNNSFNQFFLFSTANSLNFYEHIGLSRKGEAYIINKDNVDDFMNKIETKYHLEIDA